MIRYLKARFEERSTWLLIGGGVGVASALPWPWSLFSIAVSIIAALTPDGPVAGT